MERKEKTTPARFKRGRAEVATAGTSSRTAADFMGIFSPMSGGRESGIEGTGPAEASTGPKWNPRRDGSGAERLELGDRADCRFAWRDAGEPRGGAHQSLRQFRLPLGFPRSDESQDEALVQQPHLRQPRPRAPR